MSNLAGEANPATHSIALNTVNYSQIQPMEKGQLPQNPDLDSDDHTTSTSDTSTRERKSQPRIAEPASVNNNTLEAQTSREVASGPPPLPYDLRDHVLWICIFWFFILAECCFIPVAFYYGIGNATHLRPGALFAIITSVFGFVSGVEYALRGWRLLRRQDTFRPLNDSPRFWGFDSTQWVLLQPYTVMTGVLIGFSIPEPPIVKGLALPMPLGMIILGLIFSFNGLAYHRGWTLKYFRLSSFVKGSPTPPLTVCVMEDVIAVDGSAGKAYREAVLARYQASPRFRRMMIQILWFWSIPAVFLGAAFIAIIYTIPKEVAYGIGWAGPCVWACLWAFFTFIIAKKGLQKEKRDWRGQT